MHEMFFEKYFEKIGKVFWENRERKMPCQSAYVDTLRKKIFFAEH